jgi:hypothetical protein
MDGMPDEGQVIDDELELCVPELLALGDQNMG